MNKIDVFPTPFWEIDVDGIDNSLLKQYIYQKYESSNKTMRRYHSDTEQKKHNNWSSEDLNIKEYPELVKLYNVLHYYATLALREEFKPKEGVKLNQGPIWFNINPQGTFVAPHQHPGCVLAGVYYVDVNDNSACLKFMHPDKALSWMYSPYFYKERTKYTTPLHSVTPKISKFVMFPGNLQHYVDVNDDGQDRVSIAFNFIQGF